MQIKNKSQPALSVVVPVHNEEDQLEHCLANLANQKNDILEVLIVDNNSTDRSLEIAKSFMKKYPNLMRLSYESEQGLIQTRNHGFRAARGDVVGRIDADTQISAGWAAAIRTYFAENPDVVALYGETKYHDLPFEVFTTAVSAFIADTSNRLSAGAPSLYGPNIALRADIARQLTIVACTAPRIMEDLDLTIHLRRMGFTPHYCRQMSVYISGRRLGSNPINYTKYCMMWPKTYLLHRQRLAASLAFIMALFGCILQALMFPLVRAYNSKTRSFSWRQMQKWTQDRSIP